jgi:uncharacterized protein YkwD
MKTIVTLLFLIVSLCIFSQSSDLERKTYQILNKYKLKFNGDTTYFSEAVSSEAREHSKLMASKDSLFHAPVNYIGEIVQYSSTHFCNDEDFDCTEDDLAQRIITSFLNSPPHKKNLERKYKKIGVGIVIDENDYAWVTIRFW